MSGATPGSGHTPGPSKSPHVRCWFCHDAIVPESTADGVVVQPVSVAHKATNRIIKLHLNCSYTPSCLHLQRLAAHDAEIALLGAAYENYLAALTA